MTGHTEKRWSARNHTHTVGTRKDIGYTKLSLGAERTSACKEPARLKLGLSRGSWKCGVNVRYGNLSVLQDCVERTDVEGPSLEYDTRIGDTRMICICGKWVKADTNRIECGGGKSKRIHQYLVPSAHHNY